MSHEAHTILIGGSQAARSLAICCLRVKEDFQPDIRAPQAKSVLDQGTNCRLLRDCPVLQTLRSFFRVLLIFLFFAVLELPIFRCQSFGGQTYLPIQNQGLQSISGRLLLIDVDLSTHARLALGNHSRTSVQLEVDLAYVTKELTAYTPKVPKMGKEALQLLHFGLNQDHGCLHCALSTGFRVFNCDPFQEKVTVCSSALRHSRIGRGERTFA